MAAAGGVFRKSLSEWHLLRSRGFGQTPKPPPMRISYGAATRRATEISSSAPVDVSQTPLYAASQIAPRRDNLRWADQANLNLVTGPEACEGRSVPGIVPMLSSFEAVAKAVGDRSAGGMETSSGSLRRGTCDAVNEPSSTGRIQGMDRVTA